ncbi:phage tail protein [Massilia sp. CCM 8734]|uniref:phage tail protein n=1 Tax=Massilia sp. CCM 8734 TaxID=2609283 RepID=UPI0014224559|nr:phage tail protein [Massilia sp. CCM 8734]NIA00860.1 hypothetical protein [Massilia sp. CCM 8734]
MSKFFNVPTNGGLAELAAAHAAKQTARFTHLALGDGAGAATDPDAAQAGLVREVYRAEISSITVHPDHPTWLVFEAAIPENVGGWTVREIGLIGGRASGGMLMAVGNYPATEKPLPVDGQGRALVIYMIVAYASVAAVDLTVSQYAYATERSVLNAIAAHEAKADPHPIYLTKAEADAFYDRIGLAASAIEQDAARLSSHVAHADPHPQYMNSKRAANSWAEHFFYAAGL